MPPSPPSPYDDEMITNGAKMMVDAQDHRDSTAAAAAADEDQQTTTTTTHEEKKTLFLGNLPADTTQREVYLLCRHLKGYTKSSVLSHHARPSAFVSFENQRCAEGAMEELQGTVMDPLLAPHMQMRVDWAKHNMKAVEGDLQGKEEEKSVQEHEEKERGWKQRHRRNHSDNERDGLLSLAGDDMGRRVSGGYSASGSSNGGDGGGGGDGRRKEQRQNAKGSVKRLRTKQNSSSSLYAPPPTFSHGGNANDHLLYSQYYYGNTQPYAQYATYPPGIAYMPQQQRQFFSEDSKRFKPNRSSWSSPSHSHDVHAPQRQKAHSSSPTSSSLSLSLAPQHAHAPSHHYYYDYQHDDMPHTFGDYMMSSVTNPFAMWQLSGQVPSAQAMLQSQLFAMSVAPTQPVNANDYPPCSTLFVANIPERTEDDELVQFFKRFGGYSRLKRKQSKPLVCFVEFADIESARHVHANRQGATFRNEHGEECVLKIQFARQAMASNTSSQSNTAGSASSGSGHKRPRQEM